MTISYFYSYHDYYKFGRCKKKKQKSYVNVQVQMYWYSFVSNFNICDHFKSLMCASFEYCAKIDNNKNMKKKKKSSRTSQNECKVSVEFKKNKNKNKKLPFANNYYWTITFYQQKTMEYKMINWNKTKKNSKKNCR